MFNAVTKNLLGLSRRYIRRYASTLVVVEHSESLTSPITYNAITAAAKFGEVTCLVGGYNCKSISEDVAKVSGVNRVLVLDDKDYENALSEKLAPVVLAVRAKGNFSHIVLGSSSFSRDLLPRVAAKLNVSLINDVIAIQSEDTFQRPIYAGNALVTLRSLDAIRCLTIRATSFPPSLADASNSPAPIEAISAPEADAQDTAITKSQLVSLEKHKSDRPELTAADVVISGGRGLKSAENFELIYKLADKLNAAVGATRAAVDAGYVSNDLQVGQTGKIVAPKLYMAIGISGAIQHLAGMKDSKVIVAINKDPEAPIFQVADYGLVEDLFKAVPEMTKLV